MAANQVFSGKNNFYSKTVQERIITKKQNKMLYQCEAAVIKRVSAGQIRKPITVVTEKVYFAL
ncbi:MAG: hypothetical protein PHV82_16140 [Victivallaceae bacterium]|nr:hypothetical protein [Victivallaceae bacterium]